MNDVTLKVKMFFSANTRCYGSSVQSTNQRQLIMSAMHMLINVAEGERDDALHTHYDLRCLA